jgi:hypothetical protein
VGPRTGLDDVEKRKFWDSNSDPSAVQPVASLYTHCTVPTPIHYNIVVINPSCTSNNRLAQMLVIRGVKCLNLERGIDYLDSGSFVIPPRGKCQEKKTISSQSFQDF